MTTKIEWTDRTWNPVRGCSMANGSETGGCLNCYAARMASRNLPELMSPTTGKPFARILDSGPRWTGAVELIEKALPLPLKWRKPQRVFVNSMSDLFHEALPDEAIDRVFAVMALSPQHTFQVLTKRPERMLAWSNDDVRDKINCTLGYPEFADKNGHGTWLTSWPLPNVWLGVSCEDQKTADARIPLLLQTPAAKRFVSYEPALGPVDFNNLRVGNIYWDAMSGCLHAPSSLDWVIVGGESGPGARPFDIAWARQTVEQCKEAGVACFVKQLGAKPFDSGLVDIVGPEGSVHYRRLPGHPLIAEAEATPGYSTRPSLIKLKDRKGGDMEEWPEDLRVRQFPLIGGSR